MNRIGQILAIAGLSVAGLTASQFAAPAAMAQFSESFQFLKAVRERDGTAATEALNKPGGTIVNTRDVSTGETALHIVVQRRDVAWINFLGQRGANMNVRDNRGITPLMTAVMLRHVESADALIGRGARVDDANNSGETPLIRAVQLRDIAMVRALLKAGANPDRSDSLAGLSARDYAAQDGRSSAILGEIETTMRDRAAAAAAAAGTQSGGTYGPN